MASEDLELQEETEAALASLSATSPSTSSTTSPSNASSALPPAREPRGRTSRRGNDWRVLLVFFVFAGIVESQAFGHLGAFTPLFLQQLNVAPSEIPTWTGVLSGLGFVFGLPLLPFWGVWADRYSRKLIIVRSAYIEGVLFTVAALSPNVWVLAVARFLGGFVLGNTGVMLALLADQTPRKRLGLAVGLASAGFPIGSSIGPFAGGLIVQHLGIRALLGIDAGASAFMGLVLTLVIIEVPRLGRAQRSVGQLLRTAASDIVHTPIVVRLFALYFLAMFGTALAQPFIPILLQQLYTTGNSGPPSQLPTVLGATLTAAGIAMAITTPIWGRLGDGIGRWRILPICIAATGLMLAAEALAPMLVAFQGAIVVAGLFQGGIAATILALLATLTPTDRRATVLTFSLMPSQLSWFLGPIAGAAIAGVALRLPFAVGAGFACAALVVALMQARANSTKTSNRGTITDQVPTRE